MTLSSPRQLMDLPGQAINFFNTVADSTVEIYNEFSLQHELGIWLRSVLPVQYKVQFERNIRYFGIEDSSFIKKEIDIVIFNPARTEKHAIELKFPRNGQHPEQMYSSCKDIRFLEQLCENGFTSCLFIMVADDPLFYQGDASKKIYSFFRASKPIHGQICKPTGSNQEQIDITGEHVIRWRHIKGQCKYAVIEIGNS